MSDERRADLSAFALRLRRRGIAPPVADRLAHEMADHLDDLVDELVAAGESEAAARANAFARLGEPEVLAASCSAYPELHAWWKRHPRVAVLVYPLMYVAALPAAPVVAGFAHRAVLARWTACLFASGVVTSALFWLLTLAVNSG